MSLSWEQITIDSIAPADLGQWWCDALNWVVVDEDPQTFEIRPSADQMPGFSSLPRPSRNLPKIGFTSTFVPMTATPRSTACWSSERVESTSGKVTLPGSF